MFPSPRWQIAPANPLTNLAPSPGGFSIHQLLGLQLLHWHRSLHTQLGCGTCGFLRWGRAKGAPEDGEDDVRNPDCFEVFLAIFGPLGCSGRCCTCGCSEMGRNGPKGWCFFKWQPSGKPCKAGTYVCDAWRFLDDPWCWYIRGWLFLVIGLESVIFFFVVWILPVYLGE